MRIGKWGRGGLALAVVVLLFGCLMAPVLATDASEVASLISFERTTPLLIRGSVINQASFGLFDTAYDHANRVDQVGRVQGDGLAWDLGRAPGGDGSSIVYTGLGNIADEHSLQLGKVRPWGPGVFAGFVGYHQWEDKSMSGSEGGADAREHDELSGVDLKLLYGWQAKGLDWGLGLTYRDGEDRQVSSGEFWGSDVRDRDASRIQIKGAIGDHSREDFGWSVFGAFATGDAKSDDRRVDNYFDDDTQTELYDLDRTRFAVGSRLNWYKGKNQYELKVRYADESGDLNNRSTFLDLDDGDRYEEFVTADSISSSSLRANLRWYNHLSDKVTFAAGLGVEFSDSDVKLDGTWDDDGSTDGTFRSDLTREGLNLSIPTGVMFRLSEKWSAVVGAEFLWYDEEDAWRDGFSTTEGSSFESDYREESTHTDTDYSAGLHYNHSEFLNLQAGFQSGGTSNGRHDVDVSRWTMMLSLAF